VPRVPDLLPDRIRHVVLLSAVVPPDRSRVLDQIDPGVRDLVEQSIAGGIYHQTREGAAAMLCNDMDEATAASTLGRLADDSAALLTESVDLSGYKRGIPRTYVHLTRDQCYVEELQQRSIALLRPDVIDLDTGHMAMISAPAARHCPQRHSRLIAGADPHQPGAASPGSLCQRSRHASRIVA